MQNKHLTFKIIFSLILFVLVASFTWVNYNIKVQPVDPTDKLSKLKLPAGFKAEYLYGPSENKEGSWVAMCFDDKGRMITSDQYGGLYRLTVPAIGASNTIAKAEKLKITSGVKGDTLGMGYANGLLHAFNSLYVVINNGKNNRTFPRKSGLYRLQDTDGNDQYDKITMMKEFEGEGEHGPHSIILSPDKKSLYLINGNHTDVPEVDAYRLPKTWQEDQLFPLIKDPRGHANDRMAPGGYVLNLDPEGKRFELVSAGYRNAFDIAFNENGDLFAYDADMEWDFGLPWYRPTRICHVTSGSEFGWRTGNSKWSPTFPDNLPPVINIGQGSPVNLIHLKDAKVPAKYKSTLLAFDWTFGVMHGINLKPQGSSYTATREEFLSGIPLPLTDGAVGPDGAIYFMTGGRRLESDVYRIYYAGSESTGAVAIQPINALNTTRRNLEKFHTGGPNPAAISTAWPLLKSPDRFIRYAARIAIEHQPVAQWQAKALAEKDPVTATQALISLIRQNPVAKKNEIITALNSINYKALQESQQLDILRAYELAFLRFGMPDEPLKAKIIANLNPNYPGATAHLNRALSKNLLYLDAPGAVKKTMDLMKIKTEPGNDALNVETATATSDLILRNPQYGADLANMLTKVPPAQHTYYANVLTMAKTGWTPALQETYFKWFADAFQYKGGRSYVGFIDRSRKLALKNVPEAKRAYFDKLSGAEMLSKNGNDLANITNYPKGPGRRWTTENALPYLTLDSLKNRDYENGKNMFAATTCRACHQMQGEGGATGPDLTQLGTRFSTREMLEAITDPDKAISDQYSATQYSLRNGSSVVGRLINEDKLNYYVSQNPYTPDVLTKIPKKNVVKAKLSAASIMFPGLINSLNKEELKDLMAYLMAGGKKENSMFSGGK
jgi:putative heme-binding domain-containing protein